MVTEADLRELSELNAPERAFLSVYLRGPQSVPALEGTLNRLRKSLSSEGPERSEREHFDQNVSTLRKYLKENPLEKGSLCVFVCWALDYLKAIPLAGPIEDFVCIDSSPFVRPLAEFLDEYENVAVVVADNKKARIFLVASKIAGSEEQIAGNVKNHVRKGGWSQQRYERRRDKELLLYAREIVEALERLSKQARFRRVLLVGGKEILNVIRENLPDHLARITMNPKAFDLGKGTKALEAEIWELFFEEERRSEKELWEKIRGEYLRGGLGVAGLVGVLKAAEAGRAEAVVVERDLRVAGSRCRNCGRLHPYEVQRCEGCGSTSVFAVELVNEICELISRTGGTVDFVDPIASLAEAGRIAALLRY